ncbi:MAG: hypothetical protein OXH11_17030 [Candidatus Aminicenantes bacterium]|nr:hypothetical protein [Candidatus Aminicenantes bacterium]
MNTHEEPERETEALRASHSRLSAANLRVSESPDVETVMREAPESLRQGVRWIPPLGVKQMEPYG